MTSGRVQQLDALRGFALLGIVLGNVQWFSGYAVDPTPTKDALGLDTSVTFALHVLVDGKFYALFSLLFGASFSLMLQRERDCGRDPNAAARARLLALFLVGCAHATLVWFGDILSLYAVAAVPLAALLRCSDAAILRWSVGLLLSPMVVSGLLLLWLDPAHGSALIYGPIDDLPAFASGGVAELLSANAAFLKQRWILALGSGRLLRLLGLFLLGALLIRRRPVLTPLAWGVLFTTAITSNLALAVLADVPPLPPSSLGLLRDSIACVALPTGALAYATVLWRPLSANSPVTNALAHAGRLSATHYLSQSLVLALVFYGVGFGVWGTLGATGSVLVGGALALTQLAISPTWRTRFGVGPGEHGLRILDRRLRPATSNPLRGD
ncbi:MAG: DUF418 domain-containing protein [Nannocystales bacterium]